MDNKLYLSKLNNILDKPLGTLLNNDDLNILDQYLRHIYSTSFFEFESARGYEKDPFTMIKNKQALKLIRKYSPKKILIVGSGLGFLENKLNKMHSQIISTDISLISLKHQLKYNNSNIVLVSNAYALPFKNNAFDMVICIEVLEHLYKPLEAAQELARVASRSIIVSFPTDPSWSFSRLGIYANPYESITIRDAINKHVGHISVRECANVPSFLEKTGWRIKKKWGYHSIIPPDFKIGALWRKMIRAFSHFDYFFSSLPWFCNNGIATLYFLEHNESIPKLVEIQ